jgi:hypothetical protein
LVAGRYESLGEASKRLSTSTTAALEAVEALRPLLDEVGEDLALLVWLSRLSTTQATPYAASTGEGQVIAAALGQIVSALRRTAASLTDEEAESQNGQMSEPRPDTEAEAVPA